MSGLSTIGFLPENVTHCWGRMTVLIFHCGDPKLTILMLLGDTVLDGRRQLFDTF